MLFAVTCLMSCGRSSQTFSCGTGYVSECIPHIVLLELRWLLSHQVDKPIEGKMLTLRLCLNHEKCHWSLNNMKMNILSLGPSY